MTTLKALSQHLGLSIATVSRALNGYPEVNKDTRERVKDAAAEMGYVPNRVAQRLVTGRSGMVGLIAKVNAQFRADQTFYEMLAQLTAELSNRDIDLVLAVDQGDDPVAPYERMLARNILDGFILNAPATDDPRIAYLSAKGIPFVVHGREDGDAPYPFFDLDNERVGFDGARHLLDLGHRRILMLNGPSHLAYAQDRARGAARAFASADVSPHGLDIQWMDQLADYGEREVMEAFAGPGPHPTAILCHSMTSAFFARKALGSLAKRVPEEISLVAHDDGLPELLPEAFDPPLTATRSDLREACLPLADALASFIESPGAPPKQTAVTAPLIERGSTAPPTN